MKLSKKILALLLAGAMAASAAACAGSEPAASTAGGAAASAPAASAPADGGEAAASEAAPADDWAAKVGTKTFPAIAKEDLKIGFLYVGPVGPFREGNGRSTRIWLDHMLKTEIGKVIDWSKVDKEDYLLAIDVYKRQPAYRQRLLQPQSPQIRHIF